MTPVAALGPITPEKNTTNTTGTVTIAATSVDELIAVPMVSSTLPARASIVWATSLSRRVPLKLAKTRVANPPKAENVAICRLPTTLSEIANIPGTTTAARVARSAAAEDQVGTNGVASPAAASRERRRGNGRARASLVTSCGFGPGRQAHRTTPGASTAELAFLLHGPLGQRSGLQAGVRDRLAALHRKAIGTVGQPGLGALERGQLAPEVLQPALVELVLVEVLGVLVPRLEASVALQGTVLLECGQGLFDAGAFVGE